MRKVDFMGWKDCVEITSGDFRILVTTEIGPRIIGGFIKDSENIFCVVEDTAGNTGGDEWKLYGGHRLWTSPEEMPRTYEPDNHKVEVNETEEGIKFSSGTDKATGIYKSITITPKENNFFELTHVLRNDNCWDVELAAWALSVMAPGGVSVVPQPKGDIDALLPNRYLTIWPYTNMSDPRLTWGGKYILMRQDANSASKCKYGLNGEHGWLAYANKGTALIKHYEYETDAVYPDNGCSIELFTNDFMLEVETLSPLYLLAPGNNITHIERWEGLSGIGDITSEKDAEEYFA